MNNTRLRHFTANTKHHRHYEDRIKQICLQGQFSIPISHFMSAIEKERIYGCKYELDILFKSHWGDKITAQFHFTFKILPRTVLQSLVLKEKNKKKNSKLSYKRLFVFKLLTTFTNMCKASCTWRFGGVYSRHQRAAGAANSPNTSEWQCVAEIHHLCVSGNAPYIHVYESTVACSQSLILVAVHGTHGFLCQVFNGRRLCSL